VIFFHTSDAKKPVIVSGIMAQKLQPCKYMLSPLPVAGLRRPNSVFGHRVK